MTKGKIFMVAVGLFTLWLPTATLAQTPCERLKQACGWDMYLGHYERFQKQADELLELATKNRAYFGAYNSAQRAANNSRNALITCLRVNGYKELCANPNE